MNLSKYSQIIKFLTIIPFLVGLATLSEQFLPLNQEENIVMSKSDSFRLKTSKTTYTVNFQGINDQFTKEIYDQLNKGDRVTLYKTKFNQQIREIGIQKHHKTFNNNTGEGIALYFFGSIFLLSILSWFFKSAIPNRLAIYIVFIILMSIITGARMFL